jgi:hypothetical protein
VKRSLALLAIVGMTTMGCRAAAPIVRPVDPDLQIAGLAHRTDFETGETRSRTGASAFETADEEPASAEIGPEPAPAENTAAADGTVVDEDVGPNPYRDDGNWPSNIDRLDTDKHQKQRSALFWSGVVLLAVGAAATAGLMAGGQIVESRLNDGYEGSMSREREQRLRGAGDTANQMTWVTGGVSIVGLGLLLAGYGLDYSVCGKLAKRRKKCRGR